MKSSASIVFIVLFLIKCVSPGVDLSCELQKLPNLFEHYAKHKATNNDSFGSFLADHFLGDHQQQPDPDHKNLPFHGSHQCCHASFFYAADERFSPSVFAGLQITKSVFVNSMHSSAVPDSLFQPPQA